MSNENKTVAVLGAGTMGSGIAVVMARAGHRTLLFDVDEANLARGVATVHGFFDKSVKLGKLDATAGQTAKDALVATTDLDDLAPCDVVVEAVFEDLPLKKDIFGRLDEIVSVGHCEQRVPCARGDAAGQGDELIGVRGRLRPPQHGVVTRALGFQVEAPPGDPHQRVKPVRRADGASDHERQPVAPAHVLQLVEQRVLLFDGGPRRRAGRERDERPASAEGERRAELVVHDDAKGWFARR